ncbi:MAG: hypothetical protein MET45_20930 [Nostoc sp. LLA-1]|nr:hypothetical protein [Cyanocohniella sp. LLY]
MSNTNGLTNLESLESIAPLDINTIATPPKPRQQRVKVSRLKIDAGNGRIKFLANGYFDVIRSIISTVTTPRNTLGAFEWEGTQWLIGADADVVNDAESRIEVGLLSGAKINYFPHMVLGAIASHPTFLDGATKVKGEKFCKRLIVDIECLAFARGEELLTKLQTIQRFSKDGMTYEVQWRYFTVHPEGYGAAIVAHRQMKELDQHAKQFHILDIGNGTITLTTYNCFGNKPLAGIPRSGSGGGVLAILEKFSEAANYGDHETIYLDQLRKALERSIVIEDNGSKRYQAIVAGSRNDVGASLQVGLRDWKDKHPATRKVLKEVDEALLDGEYVFCCGGGFEIPPIEDFIRAQFPHSDRLIVLPTPGTISLRALEEIKNG